MTTTEQTAEPTVQASDGIALATTEIRETVDRMARSVPDVARSSRTLMEDTMQTIERSSDERVAAGVTLSLGLAIGMLLGGAPRLLTVLALVPVAAFGLVLMDRRTATSGRASRSTSATSA
jgi:hypothetical protein